MSTSSRDVLSRQLDAAIAEVDEFGMQVEEYASWVDDYQALGEYEEAVERSINRVAASWRRVEELKRGMDAFIAAHDYTVQVAGNEILVDSVERFLHNSVPLDPDELSPAAVDNYSRLAAFNKAYVAALSTIVRYEPVVDEMDAFDQSPEDQVTAADTRYTPIEERITNQIDILRAFLEHG